MSEESAIKLALRAKQMRGQIRDVMAADPVSVIGMACRLPGADGVDEYWSLLHEGRSAIGPVPADRWDAAAWHDADVSAVAKSVTREGAFLDRIDGFDAAYFGILPREADAMDPQQRLFLEVAIEALDDAGLSHAALRGSRTGVYVASYHNDYAQLAYADPAAIDLRTLTGTLHSIIPNRLSYLLDLRGPSVSIDTACSASLVAVHLACQSLRFAESDIALAGGVSLMAVPELMVAMSKVGFMAADGRSKPFSDLADGFGRGEGCAVVVLKRLSDAVADGDRLLGVVRGSAVNQDGRSAVLSAPNGPAQQALIREALAGARMAPSRIGYVEAHGTGTPLGDPIEVEAIAATIGVAAPGAGPCLLGSAKANIGHLEAGAGVAGLIKALLAIRHATIPPQPGLGALNPHLRLDGSRLAIPRVATPWPAGDAPRAAAVSSFGVGGTNAHVIVEEAPVLPAAARAGEGPWLLPLSAQSGEALDALAARWRGFLAEPGAAIPELCATAALRRTHYPVRTAVVGRTAEELATALAHPPRAAAGGVPRIGFVFSGQGPQWHAMARGLMAEPAFRTVIDRCDALLRPLAGWSLIEMLGADEATSRLNETEIAQPALFAVQAGIGAWLASRSIVPDMVCGHSLGEIAALHAAGALDLEEAIRIVWQRGRIMQAATGLGAMAQVALDEAAAHALVAEHPGLDVGAINAPRSVVLSGDRDALDAALTALDARRIEQRRLPVDYAFHSAQMAPLAAALVEALGPVRPGAATLPVYSTVTGAQADAAPDAAYFGRNVRAPVRFADAIAAMLADGCTAFVEIAPHPVLAPAIGLIVEAQGVRAAVIPTLRRGRDDREQLLGTCAALYTEGVDPDWRALQPGAGRPVALPAYPWQRRRHWLAPPRSAAAAPALASAIHPLLGAAQPVAGSRATLFAADAAGIAGWIEDHRIFGQPLLPGAAFVEGFAAAARWIAPDAAEIRDLAIHRPLVIDDAAAVCWQIVAEPDADGLALRWYALAEGDWTMVAEARAATGTGEWQAIAPAGVAAEPIAAGDPARGAEIGFGFGAAFRRLEAVRVHGDIAEARVTAIPAQGHTLHPALLDAAFQLAALVADPAGPSLAPSVALLPIAVDRARIDTHAGGTLIARARIVARTPAIIADVSLETPEGTRVAAIGGLRLQPGDALAADLAVDRDLYAVAWREASPIAWHAAAEERWLVVGADGPVPALLVDAVRTQRIAMPADKAACDAAIAHAGAFDRVVYLALEPDALAGLLHLAQALVGAGHAVPLTILTCDAQIAAAGDRGTGPGADVWALGDVIGAEHPELAVRIVDLDAAAADDAADLIAAIVGAPPRAALRGDRLLVPRLARIAPGAGAARRRLVVAEAGTLDGLAIVTAAEAPLPADAVRLRVHSAGLNFRDVLTTLGLYPGVQPPLGVECAGEVIAVGARVDRFAVGDRVFGYAPGSFADEVIARADFLAPLPPGLSPEQASAIPVAFLTAWYGLHDLGCIAPGDRVLIHAGTGGVGMAAIQIARAAGATVYATAGTPAKRALLMALGVAGAFDSRSASFADDVLAATAGRGVDIVLNALSGALIAAGIRTLAPGGRFLEIGKRDVWSAADVAAVRPDVGYHLYDLGAAAEADPALLGPIYARLLEGFAASALTPLPLAMFDLADAAEAMRTMAQARHVGKLALRIGGEPALRVRRDATYLVTGGLGGIGIETAAHLVARGARHLVLVGRRAPSDEAAARVAALRAAGATVRVAAADVGDEQAMTALLGTIAAELPPLGGIVHAAGTLRDGVLSAQDWEAAQPVLAGKAAGARLLDRLTRDLPLDFFLLWSSATTMLGAAGQGLYPAANAELDALARRRRQAGLPALSIGWGLWAGVGMAQAAASGNWEARGLRPLGAAHAFAALDRLVAADIAHGFVLPIAWSRFLERVPAGLDAAFFAEVAPVRSEAIATAVDPLADLRNGSPAQRRATLGTWLRELAASVLGIGAGGLVPERALREQGLDSLMSVELRNLLVRIGGVPLRATLLFDYPTLDALGDQLMTAWALAPEAEAAPALDDLDESELQALLAAELALGTEDFG